VADSAQLAQWLRNCDGRSYGALKDLTGVTVPFHMAGGAPFDLHFHYIQGDPYASPSLLEARLPPQTVGIPME
ncbi:ABC transporter, ATPase, putative, partial [Kipferlia bialata]